MSQSSKSCSCRPTWWHKNQNTAALQQHFGFYKTKYTPLPTTRANNVRPFADPISSQRLIRKETSSIKVGEGPTTSQSDTTAPPSLLLRDHASDWPSEFSSTLSLLLCDKKADPHDPNTEQLLLSWEARRHLLKYHNSCWRSLSVRLTSCQVLRSCPRCWTSFVPAHRSKTSLQAFTNTRGLPAQAAWSFNSILTTNNYFNLVMYLRPEIPIQTLVWYTQRTKFDAFCTWIGSESPEGDVKCLSLNDTLYDAVAFCLTAQYYYKINIETGEL